MPFCIPLSQYDENIHDMVSDPAPFCSDCGFTPPAGGLNENYWNINFQTQGVLPNPSTETVSFLAPSSADNKLSTKSDGKYMIAEAKRGDRKYNAGLNFYLDPASLVFTDSPWVRYDLLPSDINNAFLTQNIESLYVCFDISDSYRMDMVGVSYCNGNFGLSWEPEKQKNAESYVQNGTCSGYCPPGYEKVGDGSYETCLKTVSPEDPSGQLQEYLDDLEANSPPATGEQVDALIDEIIVGYFTTGSVYEELSEVLKRAKEGGYIQ